MFGGMRGIRARVGAANRAELGPRCRAAAFTDIVRSVSVGREDVPEDVRM